MFFNKLSDFKQDLKTIGSCFASLVAVHLVVYFCLRLFFYIWNYSQLKSLTFPQVVRAFVVGIRFDLAVIGPICVLLTLMILWLPRVINYLLIIATLFFQCGLMAAGVVDAELVNFMGRRFSVSSLYIIGEGSTAGLAVYYPLFIFGGILIIGYFDTVLRKYIHKENFKFLSRLVATIGLLIFAVVCGRGGVQEKPISFINAKVLNHPFAHQLILNSGFTFIKSIGRDHTERVHFFDDKKMLSLLNLEVTTQKAAPVIPQKMNVVIFLIESLSSEYISERNTPFFTQLAHNGVLFNPAYANGRRSVEGVAAVLSGVPALMEESFINSEFATNDFVGLGTLLKTKGYQTSFFHGAQNGSMRFDSFTKAAGFDHYYGKKEFNDNTQDDGAWGIYDEPFLKFSCEKISELKEPLASVLFTLSSHVPYNLPKNYKINGEKGILTSIRYVDYALQQFFQCAQNKPWFSNTLFIIMADHTGPSLNPTASFKSNFEIPILFYTKNAVNLKGLVNTQFAQQIDILPTITDLVGIPNLAKNHLARSLYEPGNKTIALFSDHKYELVGDTDLSEDRLKAIRQYFSQGLYDNRLYFPKTETK